MSLVANHIWFEYRKNQPVIKDFNLQINPGEKVALFGPSGQGKTTICKLLTGFLTPMSGSIQVGDQPLSRRKARSVQMIWQHPEQSVDPRLKMGETLKEAGDIDKQLLERLGIESNWLSRYPSELSGGEIQRFCIARALRVDIKYLVADEITTMLDPISQAQIWDFLLAETRRRNIGILAVTHDQLLVEKIADRVVTVR
uniref:ABC transporter ATP-binding protein n=1 Tax=Vaginimicrobium propionicum TaxID=1871034 RepID=UPI000970B764|nr:ATP-binding cassette domain-containing protein [Vaginimicrobium propionicum]